MKEGNRRKEIEGIEGIKINILFFFLPFFAIPKCPFLFLVRFFLFTALPRGMWPYYPSKRN